MVADNKKKESNYYLSFSTKSKTEINWIRNNPIGFIQVYDDDTKELLFGKNLTYKETENIKMMADCVYDATNPM